VRVLAVVLAVGACSSGGSGAHDGGADGLDAAQDATTGVDASAADLSAVDVSVADGRDAPMSDAASDAATFPTPVAVQVARASAPTDLPPNAVVSCPTTGSDLTPSPNCWVIKWGRWTYWVLTDPSNAPVFILQAYDASGARAQAGWPRTRGGARYPWLVTVDNPDETIAIFGQSNAIVNVPWNDLRIDQTGGDAGTGAATDGPPFATPTVVLADMSTAPSGAQLPPNARVVCVLSGSSGITSGQCPVVKWGTWTYWAFTANDDTGFLVTPYDQAGQLATVAGWPKLAAGPRYLWQITADPAAMTVTFWGQSDATATMSWADLRIDQP